ncbi:killer cell lectin-like receptor subfamily B member 1B allele B isoform X1 [Larus michahellis]|uniref:killer cell lectin-like receptor subfamily B member 1B allele B isoform X1 n=1 Tax=Larus michahellis TaxID=119627 RepID=UPI003D9B63FD
MAEEVTYADLAIGPGKRHRNLHSLPQPGTSGCPQWHRTALWTGWTGNLLLGVAVVAMGCLLLHQQLENPGSHKNVSGNVGDGNTSLGNVCSELREALCLSNLQEGEGCMLCPMNWTLRGTKCYWVSTTTRPWNVSREDCVKRGAELLMLGDQNELVKGPVASGMWDGAGGTWGRAEGLPRNLGSAPSPGCLRVGDAGGALSWDTGAGACFGMVSCGTWASPPARSAIQDFLNKILRKPAGYFWIGLYAGDGWTWLNGSRLVPSRFQLRPPAEGRSCGVIKEGRISPEGCASALQWICQKAATQL